MNYDELIKDCIKGKSRAQRELFDLLSQKMMTVCLRYMQNSEEAEDVFQISFVKVFNSLKDYNQQGSFEGWVRRIFANSCLDQLRKNKKTKNDISLDDVDFRIENNDFILEKMAADDLLKEIQNMPDGYRTVFNMFAIEGFSHKEIADHLGVTESTSKSQYKRARSYLINCLEKLGHEER
ncbi:MAG: sigma-70 family RNA polymerase sigma factor [Bacteroidetes bacterium]|nr:sigma-70 family RNA polymerase sigma factor [Bacteroidota bacterium]